MMTSRASQEYKITKAIYIKTRTPKACLPALVSVSLRSNITYVFLNVLLMALLLKVYVFYHVLFCKS